MQDELSAISCYSDDIPALLEIFRQNNIAPQILGSTTLLSVYTAQLSGPLKTYLTLKFPNICITRAKFTKGKI